LTQPYKMHNSKSGLGLGLCIVEAICVRLEGTLSFSESNLGGLAVMLRLPMNELSPR
jgi:C4-dicarboxylate-specific signal transduction histidine kinase